MSSFSEKELRSHTRKCKRVSDYKAVTSRQEIIPGWNQELLLNATVLLLGAGGLGGVIARGLTQKGIGKLVVCDGDIVSPSNLNRQLFSDKDLYKNKAIALVELLKTEGILGTQLEAYPIYSDQLNIGIVNPDLIITCVDLTIPNTRQVISKFGLKNNIPIVFSAVGTDANAGYVFIQESNSDSPCYSCALERGSSEYPKHLKCPGDVAASIDILNIMAGLSLYSADTILMQRERNWNYRVVSLEDGEYGGGSMISKRSGCPNCADSKNGKS